MMDSTTEKPRKITDGVLMKVCSKPRNKVDKDSGEGQRRLGKVKKSVIEWSDERLAKSVLLLQFAEEICNILNKKMDEEDTVTALKATTCDIVASTEVFEEDVCASCDTLDLPEWIDNPAGRTDWYTKGAAVESTRSEQGEQEATTLEKLDKKNCMKNITIEMHPSLLRSWYMCGVRARAETAGCRVAEAPRADPAAVLWSVRRAGERAELCVGGVRQCGRCVCVLLAGEVAPLVRTRTLAQYMARYKRLGQITLLILDTAHYFRKSAGNGCVGEGKPVHGMELEMEIANLMVTLEIDTVLVHTTDELEKVILNFTKALAEEPMKLDKRRVDEQAEFYMRGDNKHCVVVDQQGNGLSNLWQQMLAVFPHSSLEVSRAVAQYYPAPRALAEGVSGAGGAGRLGEVRVCRSAVEGAAPRRLGAELARKLNLVFTQLDPNVLVG